MEGEAVVDHPHEEVEGGEPFEELGGVEVGEADGSGEVEAVFGEAEVVGDEGRVKFFTFSSHACQHL